MEPLISGRHLRRLGFDDLASIEAHLLSLEMVSRNRRFHSGFSEHAVKAYIAGLDAEKDLGFRWGETSNVTANTGVIQVDNRATLTVAAAGNVAGGAYDLFHGIMIDPPPLHS